MRDVNYREFQRMAVLRVRAEKEVATRSSIPAWRSPWTREPGGLQAMGSQSVGHTRVPKAHRVRAGSWLSHRI